MSDKLCELRDCSREVNNFPEKLPVPKQLESTGEKIMCDRHHVASRIMLYTQEDHPYVDIGLYQEVTFYSRSLAAEELGISAEDAVNQPQTDTDTDTDTEQETDK